MKYTEKIPSKDFLEKLAHKFLQRYYRERFPHEATKKQLKLHGKIAHHLEEYFLSEHLSKDIVSFSPETKCWMFEGHWEEGTLKYLWNKHSSGYPAFIVAQDLSFMYAESEF